VDLSGVELDDRLFVGDRIDLIARGDAEELDLEMVPVECHPIGDNPGGGSLETLAGELLAHGVVLHLDDVVHPNEEAGDADFAAVDLHVTVAYKLTGLGTGDAESTVIDHAVETGLEQLEHLLARHTTHPQSLLVDTAKLALLKPIEIAKFLLLHETHRVVAELAAGLGAVDTRRVVATLQIF